MNADDRSLAARRESARTVIFGTLGSPEILKEMAGGGYTEATIRAEAVPLYEALVRAELQSGDTRSDQKSATYAKDGLEAGLRSALGDYTVIAKAVFKDDATALSALRLDGHGRLLPESLAGFLKTAGEILEAGVGAPADIAQKLALRGYPKATLDALRADLRALEAAELDQERRKGLAQQATPDASAARAALESWVSTYVTIARRRLKEKPQLLEELRISVP